jgi:hypothetical protein
MTDIPAKRRKKAATVHVDGKAKFPIDSVHTAKSALKLENAAKPPLTSSQRTSVERRAATFGVKKHSPKKKQS